MTTNTTYPKDGRHILANSSQSVSVGIALVASAQVLAWHLQNNPSLCTSCAFTILHIRCLLDDGGRALNGEAVVLKDTNWTAR